MITIELRPTRLRTNIALLIHRAPSSLTPSRINACLRHAQAEVTLGPQALSQAHQHMNSDHPLCTPRLSTVLSNPYATVLTPRGSRSESTLLRIEADELNSCDRIIVPNTIGNPTDLSSTSGQIALPTRVATPPLSERGFLLLDRLNLLLATRGFEILTSSMIRNQARTMETLKA